MPPRHAAETPDAPETPRPLRLGARVLLLLAFGLMLADLATLHPATAAAALPPSEAFAASDDAPPATLHATGLYAGGPHDAGARTPADGVAEFEPQYPLWSDGADKRRWIRLPAGQAIDARNADAWVFPAGTRLWKEFAIEGRPVETRLIERQADGRWRFAAYVWNDAGTEARLAPPRGTTVEVPGAPGGRWRVPGRGDCLACHAGAPVPVLGFAALQLSPDRDPRAPHAGHGGAGARAGNSTAPAAPVLDLRTLVERGWLQGLPARLLAEPPRIAADTPVERAALGYLHGNCGHCHHGGEGRVPVRLTLAQSATDPVASRAAALRSVIEAPSRWRPPGADADVGEARIVSAGDAAASVLAQRMHSRDARQQMPPIGTAQADAEGLALVQRWIAEATPRRAEARPRSPSPTPDRQPRKEDRS